MYQIFNNNLLTFKIHKYQILLILIILFNKVVYQRHLL